VVHYAPDLVRDRDISWVHKHYHRWAVLGFVLSAVFCAVVEQSWVGLISGFLWGGMVRMFVLEQGIWSLNSLCHMVGTRQWITRDKSRNIGLLAPFEISLHAVRFVPPGSVPVTSSGKVRRRETQNRFFSDGFEETDVAHYQAATTMEAP